MKRFLLLCIFFFFATNWVFAEDKVSPFHIKNVHHILLTVKDLEASLHFYQDVLGLTLEQRYRTFAMLNAGTFGVYLSTKP
jgi:catechol-2,3-dioxygenase